MITNQILSLNNTVLKCLSQKDEVKILKSFVDTGVKILEADFGLVWLHDYDNKEWTLAYKTPNMPFLPHEPKKDGRNRKVIKSGKIDFVKNLKKTPDAQYLSNNIKSFVIIPMSYGKKVYGNIIVCFKHSEKFPKEKKTLSLMLGMTAAQTITINRLAKSEINQVILKEKQKKLDILLHQEKLKTEFIANATHEIRTPLAIMKGNIDLALMDKVNLKSSIKALKAITTEINILSSILTDLALLTSTEQNKKNILIVNTVNISDLLQKLIDRLSPIAQERKTVIKLQSNSNYLVHGDERYLDKLFLNVLKNAITYGKDGGNIWINIQRKNKEIKIEIKDDGIGISKEDLPKIFERFYRADKSHNSGGNHSGLGLAIAKWIVEIHKGAISAESTESKGSIFTISLPSYREKARQY